jgi:GNAT superfamily N-acetyltransferase
VTSASDSIDVMLASMDGYWRLMAASSPEASLIEGDGFLAAIHPAVPDRSLPNAVIYERGAGESVLAAHDELDRAYLDAGVNAWTVWVHPGDEATGAGLEEAGHALDGEPRAMALDLGEFEPDRAAIEAVDWFEGLDPELLAGLNDRAYGHEPGTMAKIMGSHPAGSYRSYGARVDGELAGGLMIIDVGSDATVAWVATDERFRGRGVCRCLMEAAMDAARQRGRKSSTLQATKLGAPVYARVGFEDLGALAMWELRR